MERTDLYIKALEVKMHLTKSFEIELTRSLKINMIVLFCCDICNDCVNLYLVKILYFDVYAN